MENYLRIAILYYTASVFYFFFALTAYAYLAGNPRVSGYSGEIFSFLQRPP